MKLFNKIISKFKLFYDNFIDNFSVGGYPARVSNMNSVMTYENVSGFVENIVYYNADNFCAIAVDCSKTVMKISFII